jgi:hypothetical protein
MAWRRVAILLVIGAAGVGCYKPKIQEGGLRCAEGGICPEGFHCASDETCRQGDAAMGCSATMPHVDPLCPSQPGAACDPICQNGCACGRCNLSGTALTCVAPGTKKRGELCNFNNDDCAPGNVCIKDCGDTIGRCYRFCHGENKTDSLCEGNNCDLTLNDSGGNPTTQTICEPPIESCDPVVDSHDCADPALGCYVGPTGAPVCDCRGTAALGGSCGPYNSCIPGFRCVRVGGLATCFKTCRIGGTDCTAPDSCGSLGEDTFGFCRP